MSRMPSLIPDLLPQMETRSPLPLKLWTGRGCFLCASLPAQNEGILHACAGMSSPVASLSTSAIPHVALSLSLWPADLLVTPVCAHGHFKCLAHHFLLCSGPRCLTCWTVSFSSILTPPAFPSHPRSEPRCRLRHGGDRCQTGNTRLPLRLCTLTLAPPGSPSLFTLLASVWPSPLPPAPLGAPFPWLSPISIQNE